MSKHARGRGEWALRHYSADGSNDLLKHSINGDVFDCRDWHRQLLKRYVNGRLVLHIHTIGDFGAICLRAQADELQEIKVADGAGIADMRSVVAESKREVGDRYIGASHQKQPMLVRVYELIQPPQRLIPTVVGLHALNDAENICGNQGHERLQLRKTVRFGGISICPVLLPKRKPGDVPVVRIGDIKRRVEPLENDLKHHMVKRCSGIGETVADRETDGVVRLNGNDGSAGPTAVNVFLGTERVRILIDVSPNFVPNQLQVLFGPDDFEVGTV